MLGSVLAKSLRDQRRGLVGWSIGVVVLVAMVVALWPSVRDIPDIEEFLSNYPEALRELFHIEEIATGAGFLNAELYSIMLPAMFLVFAIGRGARLVAGEEETGTLEVLLATPVTRTRVLLEKAAALAVSVVALGAVLLAVSIVSASLAGMDVGLVDHAGGAVSMVLLGVLHGWVALAVGAGTGRRSASVGVAAGLAGAGYLLYVMGQIVDAIEPWRVLSAFHQALDGGPVGAGVPASYLYVVLAAVVALVAAVPVFDRRDLAI